MKYYRRIDPCHYATIAVILIVAAVLVVHSCTGQEQKKVARDEVRMAMLNLEQRQEVINRLGKELK